MTLKRSLTESGLSELLELMVSFVASRRVGLFRASGFVAEGDLRCCRLAVVEWVVASRRCNSGAAKHGRHLKQQKNLPLLSV